ncbi:MAG: hypothetical protein AAGA09_03565 [Pseudomonadota bacterium]
MADDRKGGEGAIWREIACDVRQTAQIVADLEMRITVMHREMRETASLLRRINLAQKRWSASARANTPPPAPRRTSIALIKAMLARKGG